jgi:type II secretory pathway pseudopilin PulG
MKNNVSAFTLVEILLAMGLGAILLLVGLPSYNKIVKSGERERVVAKAIELNNAKSSYVTSGARRALESAWAGMSEDDKYLALTPFLSMPPPNLAAFTPAGYKLVLGDLYAKTSITSTADGTAVTYEQ